MKCAACNGGMPPGKVIFCPTCFSLLPKREQADCRSHYLRICRTSNLREVKATHPGMVAKVAKATRMIREARKLPPDSAAAPGVVLVDVPRETETMLAHRAALRANPIRS